MRLLSRYPSLVSRNTTWRLFSRPNTSFNSGINLKARLGSMQIRMAAHVVPPPAPSFPSNHDESCSIARILDLSLHFKELFRRSPPDLPEQLLSAILQSPGVICVVALSSSLYYAEPLDVSIRSVVQVLPRTSDVIIENDTGYYDNYEPGSFRDRVKSVLIYLIRQPMQDPCLLMQVPDIPKFLSFLNAALFSASAIKNGLLDEGFIYAFTRYGLQLSASEMFENDKKEVAAIRAVGACLQLITAGSVFMEKYFAKTNSLADIIAALEALRAKNFIDYPGGSELLDKTIEAAKANFANPLSPSHAWKILFPTEPLS